MKKINSLFFSIEQSVPYIPDFRDAWTVLKILLVSFLLCVIYSFSQVQHASEFYLKFVPNLQIFAPYVISQLLLLIFSAKIISKNKPVYAILIIITLKFIVDCRY